MARNKSKAKPKPEYTLQMDDLLPDGRGVARYEGKAIFVRGALVGETVRAQQTVRHSNYDEAIALQILHASPLRIEPKCAHYGVCSGCVLQHLAADEQLVAKQKTLFDTLQRVGHVRPEEILPMLHSTAWQYRRKGRFSVRYVPKKDAVLVGFREFDPRAIAQLETCHTVVPEISALIVPLSTLIFGMLAKSEIPQIEFIQGDGPVALVFRHLNPLCDSDILKLHGFSETHAVQIYLQPGGVNSVQPLKPDYPALSFRLQQTAIEFEFKPLDFIQVNASMNEKMIERTLQLLELNANDEVLDMFCGLGNFTLPMAKHCKRVVGVEGDANLVLRAEQNAVRNEIHNTRFFSADLTQSIVGQAWNDRSYTKLLLDPPRAGAIELLRQLDLKGITRIVYVSCHPASLARDAGFLVQECGYRLMKAGAMDMFPQTGHVESIAVFEKN